MEGVGTGESRRYDEVNDESGESDITTTKMSDSLLKSLFKG